MTDDARVERMRHFIEAVAKGIYGDEPTLQKDASDVLAGSVSNGRSPRDDDTKQERWEKIIAELRDVGLETRGFHGTLLGALDEAFQFGVDNPPWRQGNHEATALRGMIRRAQAQLSIAHTDSEKIVRAILSEADETPESPPVVSRQPDVLRAWHAAIDEFREAFSHAADYDDQHGGAWIINDSAYQAACAKLDAAYNAAIAADKQPPVSKANIDDLYGWLSDKFEFEHPFCVTMRRMEKIAVLESNVGCPDDGVSPIPPGPVQRLGEHLAQLLNDDQWNGTEPFLMDVQRAFELLPSVDPCACPGPVCIRMATVSPYRCRGLPTFDDLAKGRLNP